MRGKIIELNLYDVKTKHGFILGTDEKKYYFNQSCIASKTQIDNFYIGDEVLYKPESSSAKYSKATCLTLGSSKTFEVDIQYFPPGVSRRLNWDYAEETLKPGSGEREIIEKLGDVLSITRIGYHRMDQVSRYEFCLAGTTEVLKQFIRENGEFLVIFSHFETEILQQKALNVEREIRKRREIADRRPLVNFYILISNASDLIKKIDAIKGEARAAVIPFSFKELLGCKNKSALTELMLARFSEYYFENNMLGENEAIDDDSLLFGDRGKIADAVVARCHQRSNSGIFGLRRSGKTSVLKAVLRRLEWDDVAYVLVESRTYETFGSWKSVLFEIVCMVQAKLLGEEQMADESLVQFRKRLRLSSTEEDYEKRGVASFIDDIRHYCPEEKLLVIAIDEIELITYNTATSAMWRSLDAYKGFWSALRGCGCPLVVCGVNSTINEVSNLFFNGEQCDNPMYGRITNCAESAQTYLPAFTDEQTKTMINTLGRYSNIAFSNVYGQMNDAFGGQPWAIRQFCSYIFENVQNQRSGTTVYEVSRPTCDNLMRQFKNSSEGIHLCQTILQHLSIYKEEYSLLKKIALSPDKYSAVSNEDTISIDHLQKYSLIQHDLGTEYISFCIGIIQDYICKTENKDPEDMNNDERRQFVQNRVEVCEKKLKTYIRNYFLYVLTPEDGRTMFLQYINSTNRNDKIVKVRSDAREVDIYTCDFNDFFNHKKFVFYFSALKRIIEDHWSDLGKKFEASGIRKIKFSSCMEDLNAGRTDADHYDAEDNTAPENWEIDDLTMRAFRTASETIEQFFKLYNL